METASVLCYTAEIGRFERVWDPVYRDSYFVYHLVSDRSHGCSTWTHVRPKAPPLDNARLDNRLLKMLYGLDSQSPRTSLYVDANVRILQSPRDLAEAFRASGADIGLYKHYSHHQSLRDEVSMCIKRGKVSQPHKAIEEVSVYAKQGMPEEIGVWEGSVIFKNTSSEKLKIAMNEWWDLFSRFQTRDQFSLPFVIWKHGLKVFDLDSHSPGREHYFLRLQHSNTGLRNRTARYLQARAPESKIWRSLHHSLRRLNAGYAVNE